jgi:hypothetical protein
MYVREIPMWSWIVLMWQLQQMYDSRSTLNWQFKGFFFQWRWSPGILGKEKRISFELKDL